MCGAITCGERALGVKSIKFEVRFELKPRLGFRARGHFTTEWV